EPKDRTQSCPSCGSTHTIRRGTSKPRHVRHLPIWGNITILILPTIRLSCKCCNLNFTWIYSFVAPKSRYSNDFKQGLSNALDGATVKHAGKMFKIPYTSAERFIKVALATVIPLLQNDMLALAQSSDRLVIGIDDFAIRKGHTYNTGFHDLRNGSLLTVVNGRKCTELLANKELLQMIYSLSPIAVVMDLAKSYHNFAQAVYPNAIRIADHFHVNRYMTDALQTIRKRITKDIPTYQGKLLKQHKELLDKRHDCLKKTELATLDTILKISTELTQAYWFKEQLIHWYDYANKGNALYLLEKWINEGERLEIVEIDEALKTFKNWKIEIANYHKCRFTNAAVEGRNNKIKALQRRCYFLRNRKVYEQRIYLECNSEVLAA
ncbi:MAG: ISL3 family transposase, partial [Cellulosilyticaceae bacterium]